MIYAGRPSLILAPMEGVTDFPMRKLMSERGGFTHCVSEFLRVSQHIPPQRSFYEHQPELRKDSKTDSGIPVQLQILGGDPEKLAQTAQFACILGSPGVDINFGCPAPTVNRHDGGATLLKYPQRIRSIVQAVRAAVPSQLPVSAKLRLGWEDPQTVLENSAMAAEGGATWITVHARTRMAGYKPPVFWNFIHQVKKNLNGLPIVANGDIWTFEDFLRCRDETQCEHFMMGRGALANPGLVQAVARELGILSGPVTDASTLGTPLTRSAWAPLIFRFVEIAVPAMDSTSAALARSKQWLRMVQTHRGLEWFNEIKRFTTLEELLNYFASTQAADFLA